MSNVIETLQAQLDALKAENEALKNPARKERVLSMKVTEKGGLSVYGMGRFPVTLYKTQWLKLIGFVDEIQAFIIANSDKLSEKAKIEVKKAA